MTNFMRDHKLQWAVKIAAAVFQASSTYRVFYDNSRHIGRGVFESSLDSILAIALIDLLFIYLLYMLESNEISVYDKSPLVMVSIGLAVFIVIIGRMEEGDLAWGPRIGIIGIIAVDVFRWLTDIGKLFYQQYRHRQSREYQEQVIRDKEVLARKKAKEKALYQAFTELEPEFLQVQIERERRNLGLTLSEKQLDFIDLSPQNREVEPGVVQLNDGHFAWINNGELVTSGSLGKPYSTQIGASRARARSINTQRNGNGKSLRKKVR